MAEIIWTEPAIENLNDIAEYIAVNNVFAAQKMVKKVYSAVNRLESFPESGRIPQEIPEFGYREVIINPCRVLYKVENNIIFILHVVRQEREIRNYIINETEHD
mgnify:FL=1